MGKKDKDGKKEKKEPKPASKTFDAELDALFSVAGPTSGPSQSRSAPTLVMTDDVADRAGEDSEGETNDVEGSDGELSSIESDAVISGISDDEEEEESAGAGGDIIAEQANGENGEDEGDANEGDAESGNKSESDDDDGSRPVHETVADPSLLKSVVKTSLSAKRKAAAREEPQSQRDARSFFIGNLPVHLATSKASMKDLRKHLISCSPYPFITQIESIRLRSIPFSKPTDDYEAKNPDEAEDGKNKRQRSRSYREALNEDPKTAKTFLSGSQKRKVAFINQEINEKADSVNAYVTLLELSPDIVSEYKEKKGKDVGSLSGSALAALLSTCVNGTLFEERHLRADLVIPLLPADILEIGLNTVQTADGSLLGASAGASSIDNESRKRTVFVGNLDFEAKEEELRGFFESLMTKERGSPPDVMALDFTNSDKLPAPEEVVEEDAVKRLPAWVYGVRIIRDAATQMGKGFGYVRFLDAACVDEIIAIHESEQNFLAASKSGREMSGSFRRKLKFKGRPVRVSRCKVSKGNVTTTTTNSITTPKRPFLTIPQRSRSSGAPTPGGSSPHFRKQQQNQPYESPSRKSHTSTGGPISNPKPMHSDPLKSARNAQKRGDPERQAKRLEKKNKKRAEIVRLADGGDKSNMKFRAGKGGKFNKKVRKAGRA
ncbi:hypothetical protein CBS101457_005161 [Exobasidium rhododendri]|nr:hypothetical protein CBS101457_005161 [Exobasidium rhododendri]